MVKFRDIAHYVWNIPYVKHPLLGLLLGVFIVVATFVSLSLFTRHGREFPMPDFRSIPLGEADELADREGLQLVVSDSTYVIGRRPGEVLEQHPKPGSQVKKGRNVFLVINAFAPQMIAAPNVLGLPIKEAIIKLQVAKLEVGHLDFEPDLALGEVRKLKYRGRPIEPGGKIPMGARMDLTLGEGSEYGRQRARPQLKDLRPRLMAMTLREARKVLAIRLLNVGRISYDQTVKTLSDSLAAMVCKVHSSSSDRQPLPLGARVNLRMTLNQASIDNPE